MPEVSQPHAEIQMVSSGSGQDTGFEKLEKKVRLAVDTIAQLKDERISLSRELQEAKKQLKVLDKAQPRVTTEGKEFQALVEERDRLLQDRHNTARRVEAMLARLKALGF